MPSSGAVKKLAALLILLTACSSGGESDEARLPAPTHVALLTAAGNVELFDPASGTLRALTTDGGTSRRYTQPTWSPDGTRLAFVRLGPSGADPGIQAAPLPAVRAGLEAQSGGSSAVHIVSVETGSTSVIETPFAPFYLYWSPDAARIAMLGNDLEFGRQGLLLLDVAAASVRRLDAGQPYYFAWSPESDRLLVHAANRELYYLDLDGAKIGVDRRPGTFSAPHWVEGSQLYAVIDGADQALSVFEAEGGVVRRSATPPGPVALGLSPDGSRVAYIPVGDDPHPLELGPLLIEDGGETIEVAPAAAAFFWSPSGDSLLYLTGSLGDGSISARWNLWDGEEIRRFEQFVPTGTFMQQYLPFFGQYANSLAFMSPDGSSFTFAGSIAGRGDGIWVQDIAGGAPAREVGDGVFSTWSPPLDASSEG